MANALAIHSVSHSVLTMLERSYPEALREDHPCEFELLTAHGLAAAPPDTDTLSLMLYRVTMDSNFRNVGRIEGPRGGRPPIALDLHYLLTMWSADADSEQVVLAWAMSQLHQHAVMDRSSLSTEGGWSNEDFVQIIPAELTNEDIMRVWDALPASYRLSTSYVARVVRIDPDPTPAARPVLASRYRIGKLEEVTP